MRFSRYIAEKPLNDMNSVLYRLVYISVILLVFLLLTKAFTRILLYEGEAVAGEIVLTYKPSYSTFMYSRGTNTYEARLGEYVNLEEIDFEEETRKPVGYAYLILIVFEDGSYSERYYYSIYVKHYNTIIIIIFIICIALLLLSRQLHGGRSKAQSTKPHG